MASEPDGSTIYLTEKEAERIRTTVIGNTKKRAEVTGHARTPREAKDAIGQATGAALMADMGSMTTQQESMPALAVGDPYPPCIVSSSELQPMKLADLRMETHHRGFQLRIKRASPVVTLSTRSWTMVQDDAEETERLEIVLHNTRHGKDILESSKTFTIKEPYFTLTEEGEPTLRIDHPSDLLTHPPPDQQPPTQPPTPEQASKRAIAHKQKGNTALTKNDPALACAWYTAALALPATASDLTRDLHRNRAHANLLLGQHDAAHRDALAALINSADGDDARSRELDAKCYFRAGAAAYALGRFAQAKEMFEAQVKLMPGDRGAAANVGEEGALTAVTCDVRDERIRVAPVGLRRAVVERLMNNPSLIGDVMGSFGDWDGGEGKEVHETGDGPVVDVFRVHDIISRNAFGVGGKDGQGSQGGGAGLWPWAALINHSCIPNSEREFVGDLMVIRATKNIAKGEEIVHSYDESGVYDDRQRALMTTWGFECSCALCAVEKAEDPTVLEKRRTLTKEVYAFLKSVGSSANRKLATSKAKRLAKTIDETYDEKKYRGMPRLAKKGLNKVCAVVSEWGAACLAESWISSKDSLR
ncbi:hypothetical protein CHGG_00272 [Chaetomium globosum CBS 148.51]|uniref:SET domain-containing protein n=1 Tax=Chaetomium globosum (strain ATCC 6205 / CBS 148.51 / DSM 1962 / NBRC 6347 / NRRL 1970) TaxID=306901 RepID=Q2HHN2_CHAGB|nr:uncharacterized protein CHGG_00272 [Chaetomium globosum CBS 148.51]EAQ92037.1 hypothetical protein CHGG_00272 [Chaetomium globosum CBS 148.51]